MGAERKSHYVTEESKKATAYHEGGHALVAMHTAGAMPLHKVSVDDAGACGRADGQDNHAAGSSARYNFPTSRARQG